MADTGAVHSWPGLLGRLLGGPDLEADDTGSPWATGSTLTSVTLPSWTVHTDDVVVVVSSSRPSSPRNTQASTPRAAKTPAITGAIRASAQPIAWAAGRLGLVSGPRKLKAVGTPS